MFLPTCKTVTLPGLLKLTYTAEERPGTMCMYLSREDFIRQTERKCGNWAVPGLDPWTPGVAEAFGGIPTACLGFGENTCGRTCSPTRAGAPRQPLSGHVLARAEGPATLSPGRLTHPAAHVALPGRPPAAAAAAAAAQTLQRGSASAPPAPRRAFGSALPPGGRRPRSRPRPLPAPSARARARCPLPAARFPLPPPAARPASSERRRRSRAPEASLEGGARRGTGALPRRRMRPGAAGGPRLR